MEIPAKIIAPVLTTKYNYSFALGVFLYCYKKAKVIPMFKYQELQNLTNYSRPIYLL